MRQVSWALLFYSLLFPFFLSLCLSLSLSLSLSLFLFLNSPCVTACVFSRCLSLSLSIFQFWFKPNSLCIKISLSASPCVPLPQACRNESGAISEPLSFLLCVRVRVCLSLSLSSALCHVSPLPPALAGLLLRPSLRETVLSVSLSLVVSSSLCFSIWLSLSPSLSRFYLCLSFSLCLSLSLCFLSLSLSLSFSLTGRCGCNLRVMRALATQRTFLFLAPKAWVCSQFSGCRR